MGIAQVSLIHSNSKLLKMEGIHGGSYAKVIREGHTQNQRIFSDKHAIRGSYANPYAEVIRGAGLVSGIAIRKPAMREGHAQEFF